MLLRAHHIALVSLAVAAPAGAQVPARLEFRVNTYTTSFQQLSTIAVDDQGDFLVVWQGDGQDGHRQGIFGQRYGSAGNPIGGEFQVNTTTSENQYIPAVAFISRGSFLVAWASLDGSSLGVFGQRFDASGAATGLEFRVNTETAARQLAPSVSADQLGRTVVAWASDGQDGSQTGIFGQRYDPTGARAGSEFQVNTYTTGYQGEPRLAHDGAGNFLVVWHGPDGSGPGVFGQRFTAAGQPIGVEFSVNETSPASQYRPRPAMADDGRSVVSWMSLQDGSGLSVMARRFTAGGDPDGGEFVVNSTTTGDQDMPAPAMDVAGNVVVAWTSRSGQDGSGPGIFARRFDPAGNPRGVEFRVNTYTTGTQDLSSFAPGMAADRFGNFVVTWRSELQDGSGDGVFAQRFGGLIPRALSVDTSGNAVLEPNETADVRPSWQNHNGATQIFGGVLVQPTGPAGPTYTLHDGTAVYGAVPDGSIQACSDCYAVEVGGSRPATHWDASAMETITPDILGQTQTWRLHVGDSFSDVPRANPFYRFIETLLHHSVTGGCASGLYCPTNSATRGEMAVFVLVADEGASYTPSACVPGNEVFADVPAASGFCRWVEELSRRGVVGGCSTSPPLYCPGQAVTRAQMAVFVLATKEPGFTPPACVDGAELFGDVDDTSAFCRWIEELARRGIVSGCSISPPLYCPGAPVTRAQMGVFISGTFGLMLYGP